MCGPGAIAVLMTITCLGVRFVFPFVVQVENRWMMVLWVRAYIFRLHKWIEDDFWELVTSKFYGAQRLYMARDFVSIMEQTFVSHLSSKIGTNLRAYPSVLSFRFKRLYDLDQLKTNISSCNHVHRLFFLYMNKGKHRIISQEIWQWFIQWFVRAVWNFSLRNL